ncbi:rhomboid family intramembrane serine protease [Hellea balneolensis]|uniref:rhomboid family intramembrane serine protease n=1 Tax=Hellea balneolensis TaxID=287478 RepID=UPI000407DD4A|nr:rhomboid family intramembrane serine protease [Hellea balneolensis]
MTTPKRPREPMFNFTEKAPAYLAGIFIAIQILIGLMPYVIRVNLDKFGVLRPLGSSGTDITTHAISLIGHGLLHGGWGHVIMNAGMTIVFGIALIRGAKLQAASRGKVSRANRDFLIIFFAGVIIGGVFQWGWWAATNAQLTLTGAVGASGGASALFAAGGWAIGGRDKMVQFGVGWAAINLVMVLLENFIGIGIAWPAHIGGYVAGMILAPLFVMPKSTRLTVL